MMRTALIVAHGQPSDPTPAEAELACLAHGVQSALGAGWRVLYATLAAPDALARAVADAPQGGIVYPLFMADGWFTKTHLPERLAQAQAGANQGAAVWHHAPPFGLDPRVQDLTLSLALEAAGAAGRAPQKMSILLAAHGSSRSAAPSDVACAMAARI
ncbi:MAG: cobalamin biosynthesis protein CbiX, partial [Rhodobacteraceae bacterium]|nr:cobalamin biosynthesis protein CbiX [Paracoccaceae bacterium]